MYYMTVDELKAIMPSAFTSNELLGIGWCDYTPEDLEAILGRSEVFIDDLKYKGHYKEEYQQHKFPRVLDTGYVVEKDDNDWDLDATPNYSTRDEAESVKKEMEEPYNTE